MASQKSATALGVARALPVAAALLQHIADAGGGIYEQLTTPGQLHDSAERAAR